MAGETEKEKSDINPKDLLDDVNTVLDDEGADVNNADEEAAFEEAFGDDDTGSGAADIDDDDEDEVLVDDDDDNDDEEEEEELVDAISGEGDEEEGDDDDGKKPTGKKASPDASESEQAETLNDDSELEDDTNPVNTPLEIELSKRLRTMEGRVGTLTSKMKSVMEKGVQAQHDMQKKGVDAPTKKQIMESIGSGEKQKLLAEKFPEWGEAYNENISDVVGKILDQMPNSDGLRQELQDYIRVQSDFTKLDSWHRGWQATVNSVEFLDFAHKGGPSKEERGIFYQLNTANDPRAAQFHEALMNKYPVWSQEFGVLLTSDNPMDAITLLDKYEAFRANDDSIPADVDGDADKVVKTAKRSKLERNVAPTRGTRTKTRKVEDSEQEAFDKAFGNTS